MKKLFEKEEGNMVLRVRQGSARLEWFDLLTQSVRRPEPVKKEFQTGLPFRAAGKNYRNLAELTHQREEGSEWARDIYGRQVLCMEERFPCFDSYDYLYENRCYRWFYIRSGDRLTCVYYTDERKQIEITEDVKKLPERCWKAIREHKWQIEE